MLSNNRNTEEESFEELLLYLKRKIERFFDRIKTDINRSTDIGGMQEKVEFVVDSDA